MPSTTDSTKLTWIVWLLVGNLLVMATLAITLVVGLLPKVERAVQTTERVEARFQGFANEVQPVVAAGSGKAVEAIKNMDAEQLSESATEKTNELMDAAAERAKRFLGKDQEAEE